MNLTYKLSKSKTLAKTYWKYKAVLKNIKKQKRVHVKYKFDDRSLNKEYVLIVLAGYKEYLWKDVFDRLKAYCPKNIDVCIVSSGMYSQKLSNIAEKNNWSYVSTRKNNVSLAQNIVIKLHPNSKYIIKMDEDIFVTKYTISNMIDTYLKLNNNFEYDIGFVAPMIPVNGYSFLSILNKTNTLKNYEKFFGNAIRSSYNQGVCIKNPEFSKFMWGKSERILRNIDKLGEEFNKNSFSYEICSIRFSIGLILFSRNLWEEMGYFELGHLAGMGKDEEQICCKCMNDSRAIVISNNAIAGHFSFGPQTQEMIKYYNENRDIFKLKEK